MCSRPAPAPPTGPEQWPAPPGVASAQYKPVPSAPPAPHFRLTSGLRPGGTSLKTGLRSRRHHQPHGSYALDQLERHETPDPVRSDAVDSRFHGVQQQADAVWLQHRWCYWGESGSCVSACRSTSPARQAASSSNRGTRGRRGPVPTSAGRRHAQAYFAQADFATYWFPRAWWGRCALWDRRAGLAVP